MEGLTKDAHGEGAWTQYELTTSAAPMLTSPHRLR